MDDKTQSLLLKLLWGFLCAGQFQFVYDSEERLRRISNENWEHYHFELDDAGLVIGEWALIRAILYKEVTSTGIEVSNEEA